MKIPAIRSKIGDWTYYISRMKFSEVSGYVKKIDQELHRSKTLREEIQRAISDNYINIKNYILNTEERFLGSLVLAVYDGSPQWIEAKIEYNDFEFYEMGFLELTGEEKIFPIDGQHRVEGIKAALKENPELENEVIPVVFIGHRATEEGMRRTRRLFTTLNRYAKPVKLDDIIALDEDDVVAITTRTLIEEYPLFENRRVIRTKQKAIPDTNKKAFTSIISLYQTNLELFKSFFWQHIDDKLSKKKIDEFLKVRPDDETINKVYEFIKGFWDNLVEHVPNVSSFLKKKNREAYVRNSDSGGDMLFRPIGLEAFAKAFSFIYQNTENDLMDEIIIKLNKKVPFNLSNTLWSNILWNNTSKKMLMSGGIARQIFIYAYDKNLLTTRAKSKLAEDIKGLWNLEEDLKESQVLKELKSRLIS